MRVTVQVSQDDIDKGERCTASSCAVARAVLRAVSEATHVRVEDSPAETRIVLYCPGWPTSNVSIDAPPSVAAFVGAYDRNLPVRPFSFDLDIPEL